MSIYQFSLPLISGEQKLLRDFRGKVLLIVNTATQCGFARQLNELQELYDKYKDAGFVVLGFPSNQFMNQEPGTSEAILQVCEQDYGVEFPLFEKIKVKGKQAHPLYKYLTNEAKGIFTSTVKWNFTKFLIDQNGKVVNRFAPTTAPKKLATEIEKLLTH